MNEHVRGNGREGAKEGGRGEYKAVIYETAPRYNERPRGQRTAKRRDTNLFWAHSEISRNKYEPEPRLSLSSRHGPADDSHTEERALLMRGRGRGRGSRRTGLYIERGMIIALRSSEWE